MKRITDRTFVYTPSHSTDIGKRFKKIISDRKAAEKVEAERIAAEKAAVVQPFKRARK